MDALSDPAGFSDVDENDPKSIARALRKMGKEMGDEMGGPEFDEAVDQLESGGGLDDDGGDDGGSGSERRSLTAAPRRGHISNGEILCGD